MDRRRYFSSSLQEYNFPQVKPQSYLYIYKHNYPQIIVRFPSPTKTITGYRLYHAEIIYHPFYQQIDLHNNNKNNQQYHSKSKIQTLELQYQGEIILSLQTSIFNTYFQQQVLNYLKQQHQTQNPSQKAKNNNYPKKQSNQHSFHLNPIIYNQNVNSKYSPIKQTQVSQIFKILLKQWLKDPQITSMFLLSQKHLKNFQSYDHGFTKLQILKTSDKTLKVPFHQYMKQRQWTQQQIANYYQVHQNKIYFFQFQSSILFTQNHDFNDVQKLGFVVPNPLTTNQFFYQVLLMIFGEFEAGQKEKQDKKKRQLERIKNREALLQNLRQIGVQSDLPDLKDYHLDVSKTLQHQDSLDKKLQQIFSKDRHNKNLLKNISYAKAQPSYTQHLSTIHNHNQSYFSNQPRRRLSTRLSDMRLEEERIDDQKARKYRSPTINKVKVIRSFTSQLLDEDFQQKPKRRFITRQQYLKIMEFNQRLMNKKQEKERKLYQEQNKIYQSPRKQKEQLIYVGLENSVKKSTMKKSSNNLNSNEVYKFDFFANHEEIVITKDQPHLKESMKYSWEEDDEFYSQDYNQDQPQEYKINVKNKLIDDSYEQFERKNGLQLNSSFNDKYLQ